MEVILREHVDNLGRRGDVVKVADGYARNYLLPRKLALPVTEQNRKQIERERKVADVARGRRSSRTPRPWRRSSRPSRSSFARRVGENDTLYGSVTSADIAEALAEKQFDDRQAEDRRCPSRSSRSASSRCRSRSTATCTAHVKVQDRAARHGRPAPPPAEPPSRPGPSAAGRGVTAAITRDHVQADRTVDAVDALSPPPRSPCLTSQFSIFRSSADDGRVRMTLLAVLVPVRRVPVDRRRRRAPGAAAAGGATCSWPAARCRSGSPSLTMTATWVDGGYLLGHGRGHLQVGHPARRAGRPVLRRQPDPRRPLLRPPHARASSSRRSIDPFEARFGKRWAAVLSVPALLGEVFWSAELLVAIGSTFGVMLGMPLTTAILLSAVVVTVYTDARRHVVGRLHRRVPARARRARPRRRAARRLPRAPAGLAAAWARLRRRAAGGSRSRCRRRVRARPGGPRPPIVNWWDVSLMLMLGGIPWNCYFQRVLSCQTPAKAQWHSILAGLLTIGVHRAAAAARRRGVRATTGRRTSSRSCRAQPAAGAADDLPAPHARAGSRCSASARSSAP